MQSYMRALIGSGLALGVVGSGACGGPNGSLGDPAVLTGQIDAWSKGGGFTLQASVIAVVTGAGAGTGTPNISPVLAMAPIDATGNFSITLPNAAALASYLTVQHINPNMPFPGCTTSNLQVNPQDFASVVLNLKAVSGGTTLSVRQGLAAPAMGSVSYAYLDRAVSESGALTCPFGAMGTSIQDTIDIHFGTGWNHETVTTMGSSVTATSDAIPATAKWTAQ